MPSERLLAEIADGQGEPLSRARLRFPSFRKGAEVSLSCLLRWILDGARGHDGEPVKLEAARLAGRWITTPAAIARFVGAQTPNLSTEPTPDPGTPTQRQRAAARAGKALDAIGI
jgi:hypothetical protein